MSFDEERCKGCELCMGACPQKIIGLSEHLNSLGYHPAGVAEMEKCTGCAMCAWMCPDVVISVEREVTA
ncbi:hypothetical protein SY88_01120 [Clostridiales bacterium PH28_bin88]|nr:hypothetical protein SY88_01120 [Clostridiales bacterium PH28_bin88]